MRKLKIAAIVAAVVCLTACSSVEQKTKEMTYDNDYYLGKEEWITQSNIEWESKDSSIVSVGEFGLVHAEKPGETTVLARDKDDHNRVIGIYKCTVETVPIKHISLPMTFSVVENDTKQFDYTLSPTDASNYGITWTTDDDSIIKIWGGYGESINIEGLTPGTATLTATTEEGISQQCKVRVIPEVAYPYLTDREKSFVDSIVPTLKEVHNRKNPIIFTKIVWLFGDQYDFEYEVTKEDGTKTTKICSFGKLEGKKNGVVWERSDYTLSGKLSLDADLVTQAEKRLWDGYDDSKIEISVLAEPIKFTEDSVTVNMGESRQVFYNLDHDKYSTNDIAWKIEDEEIATIKNLNGRIVAKGIKEGETVLTATLSDGFTASCTIEVVADDQE